jgi:flagellar basal-body rod modification protein FlgD
MTTTGTGSTAGTSGTAGTTSTTSTTKSSNFDLKTEDFIKMMITQLQNQDPMDPAKSQDLLAQMSQIGQLQSATTLQESLKGIVTQNQIGAAASMIGKNVQGLDDNDDPVHGVVSSVRVEKDQVNLELDNGTTLPLTRVTSIGGQAATPTPIPTTGT